ncbi:MAG: SPOR domain-containing protein [Pseudomonadota bacterium]
MGHYGDDRIDFAGPEEAYRSYDLQSEDTARGPLILALAAGVLVIFSAVVWNTYRQGIRGDGGALPVITAEAEPFKAAPEQSGGTSTPGQELRFYDELDGSTRPAVPVEGLRRPVSAAPVEVLAGGAGEGALPAPQTGEALPPPRGEIVSPAPGDDDSGRIAALDAATAALAQESARRPVNIAAAPGAPLRQRGPAFDFQYGGAYMVQIAALRREERAEATWETLSQRYPDVFLGAEKRIQRADLGAQGVFYRLRVGAFADRSGAAEFCAALKSTGNDCIVVR